VPSDLMDAVITPVYKRKGDHSSCDSYRGISLLAISGKILARIALYRLATHITDRILSESQAGFRATEAQLT